MKQIILWVGALVVGTILGLMQVGAIDAVANFVATVYTRLFQLLAVPTIVLAVTTTLASLGKGQGAGRIFRYTITYTLLTTIVAAAVGLMLFVVIAPGTLPAVSELAVDSQLSTMNTQLSYSDHILSIIPNNIVKPFLEGNVLSLLLLAAASGYGLARMPESDNKQTVIRFLHGLQDLLFMLIRGLIWTLPLGIVAFAAQLSAQLSAGVPMGCYFLTLSLMSGINAPIAVLGIILPIYTIIDMIETAVNVWSDSCVCAMTNHDLKDSSL